MIHELPERLSYPGSYCRNCWFWTKDHSQAQDPFLDALRAEEETMTLALLQRYLKPQQRAPIAPTTIFLQQNKTTGRCS